MAHGIPSQGKVTITVDEYSSNPTQAFTHYNINQSRFQPPHVHMVELDEAQRNLPYEYKIVIAGNHELTFDKEFMADLVKQDYYRFPSVSKLKPEDFDNVQSLLTNSIYLQDSEVTVKGFRIYGAPWR
ncbi:metallophosphoesterase MPPED2 isoform X3 [Leptonychotes weddellii]|uniref:Metallophosphoesterase MPPED2 isoform X3 n=1 Tax=Leptonychotes weddellii TaxID=9713 RepID=A0A7F8QA01_LEPWE|nr:metallophosphoesterase MPPED2 isoform X3 [Leptonychotes weddellii]